MNNSRFENDPSYLIFLLIFHRAYQITNCAEKHLPWFEKPLKDIFSFIEPVKSSCKINYN